MDIKISTTSTINLKFDNHLLLSWSWFRDSEETRFSYWKLRLCDAFMGGNPLYLTSCSSLCSLLSDEFRYLFQSALSRRLSMSVNKLRLFYYQNYTKIRLHNITSTITSRDLIRVNPSMARPSSILCQSYIPIIFECKFLLWRFRRFAV